MNGYFKLKKKLNQKKLLWMKYIYFNIFEIILKENEKLKVGTYQHILFFHLKCQFFYHLSTEINVFIFLLNLILYVFTSPSHEENCSLSELKSNMGSVFAFWLSVIHFPHNFV